MQYIYIYIYGDPIFKKQIETKNKNKNKITLQT